MITTETISRLRSADPKTIDPVLGNDLVECLLGYESRPYRVRRERKTDRLDARGEPVWEEFTPVMGPNASADAAFRLPTLAGTMTDLNDSRCIGEGVFVEWEDAGGIPFPRFPVEPQNPASFAEGWSRAWLCHLQRAIDDIEDGVAAKLISDRLESSPEDNGEGGAE